MRELIIGKNDAGARLDRFVSKALPLLPPALLQKYIRLKRIKVNGKGSKRDVRLETGDILQLYINDEFFDKPNEENLFLTVFKPQLNIVYEDENILLVDKPVGMVVHEDESGDRIGDEAAQKAGPDDFPDDGTPDGICFFIQNAG